MENIIVPTDFSECALDALEVAAAIARKANAKINLLHVYERPIYGFVSLFVDNEENRKTRAKINEELDKIMDMPFLKDVEIEKVILADMAITEMLNDKKLKESDLIVMGTHGVSGWKEYFIGSNTEKMVRLAEIPVLAIKEKHDSFEMSNLVFASDFMEEVEVGFAKIFKLAKIFNSKIYLLKVNTRDDFMTTHHCKDVMQKFADKFGLKNYSINIYNDKTIEDGILNFGSSINADVISMETHGRTGITHLLNGSITEDVVNRIPMPVLSVKI